jgi:hypothetical protein
MHGAVVIYVILSMAAIVTLSVLLATKKNCKEGFPTRSDVITGVVDIPRRTTKCVCNSREGGREEVCQDIDLVQQLYDGSVLTENTNLKSPGWDRGSSPGALAFPNDQGCSQGCASEPIGEHTPHKWQSWDFTQFGSSPSCD